MCTAMQELKAEWEEVAKKQGHKEGLAQGHEQGVFRTLQNLAATCQSRRMPREEICQLIKSTAGNPALDAAQFFPEKA